MRWGGPRRFSEASLSKEGGSTVADEANDSPHPFDLQTIKVLVQLMSRHDLSEIDLQQGDQRLRLRRGARQKVTPMAFAPSLAAPPAPATAASPSPAAEKPATKLVDVKSTTVGTFYSKPKPDAESFVTVGSKVTPTTVVGLIEAMKLFNELTADCAGVIREILVENAQAVEFDQVLFRVDPTG
jgi:acetyl-CoA carboxylase biotin carboxyl carrier protein